MTAKQPSTSEKLSEIWKNRDEKVEITVKGSWSDGIAGWGFMILVLWFISDGWDEIRSLILEVSK